jgi:hypothetical protein
MSNIYADSVPEKDRNPWKKTWWPQKPGKGKPVADEWQPQAEIDLPEFGEVPPPKPEQKDNERGVLEIGSEGGINRK